MKLSYNTYKKYKDCPRHYYLYDIVRVAPGKVDKRAAITGKAVQKAMELFYKNRMYMPNLNPELKGKSAHDIWVVLEKWLIGQAKHWHQVETDKDGQKWRDKRASEEMEAYEAQFKLIIDSIKKNKLLAFDVKSEYYRDYKLNPVDSMTGSIDFVFTNSDIRILDGKNTKSGTTYLDNEQLLWYATLLRRTDPKGRWPDQLGWWLFKTGEVIWIDWIPKDCEKLEEQVKRFFVQIRCDLAELDSLKLVTEEQRVDIPREFFRPQPNSMNCKFCAYKTYCKAHQEWAAALKIKVPSPDFETGSSTLIDM